MSAEHSGIRLLAEVHEESLDEILSEIRHSILPNLTSLGGISPLDQLLEIFRFPPSHSPSRHPGRTSPTSSNSVNDVDDETTTSSTHGQQAPRASKHRFKSAIIELMSTTSSSGKTNLLYYLAAISILPEQYNGKEMTIAWLDTDGRFSALRLHQVTRNHIARTHPKLLPTELDAITKSSIHHVHVFRPQSSTQLLSTLRNLPDYLLEPRNHTSSTRALGLLILDSATAFHWQDRSAAELVRLETGPETSTHNEPYTSTTAEAVNALKAAQHVFDSAVLFTSTPTSLPRQSSASAGEGPAPDIGISPWSAFATLTLRIARKPVPPFAPGLSMAECFRDQGLRSAAAGEGRFGVNVDWGGRQGGAGGTRAAVERMEGRGGFGVRITGEGVAVE